MNELVLLIISILPVLLVGIYIYKKDRNKEPKKLLTNLFIAGVSSSFIAIVISSVLEKLFPFFAYEITELNLIELIVYVFVGISLVEESSKWIMVYNITYNNEEFDEIYDMIVYCVFVALGFACFENILYVQKGGVVTGIIRAISAIPSHACEGVLMGYYLGLAKINSINNDEKLSKKNKILSILIPTVSHGIYDYCIFSGKLIFMFIFLILLIYFYSYIITKINKISRENRKIVYKNKLCPVCGYRAESNYCPQCGRKMNN